MKKKSGRPEGVNRSAAKGRVEIVSWTVLGHALGFVGLPILGQLVGTESLGKYGMVTTMCVFAAPIVGLRADVIVPSLKLEDQRGFVSLSGATSLFASMILAVLWFAGAGRMTLEGFNEVGLLPVLLLGLTTSVTLPLLGAATSLGEYRAIGVARLFWNGAAICAQIPIVLWFSPKISTLVYTLATSRAIGIGIVALSVIQNTKSYKSLWAWGEIRPALSKNLRRIALGPLAAAFNGAALHLPILLIGALWSSSAAGQYYFANTLVRAPAAIFVHGLSRVYCAEFGTEQNRRRLEVFSKHCRTAVFVSVPFSIAAAFIAPMAINSIFGEEWILTSSMYVVLLPAAALQLIVSPISGTLLMTEEPGRQLLFDAARSALSLSCLVVGFNFDLPLLHVLATYSAAMALCDAAYLVIAARSIKRGLIKTS